MMSYAADARRPLHSLVFLIPLILAYEIGVLLISEPNIPFDQQDRVIAYHLMRLFFSLLGVTGIFLPGILIMVILLVTHILSGEPWRVRGTTLLGMIGESLLWTLPLFMLMNSIQCAAQTQPREVWFENLVISTGAGVYEELVFRLILITAFVILLEDLLKISKGRALAGAVVVSALLFSAHHHPPLGSDPFSFGLFTFRTLAGIYLGVLFLLRGYGITAACHALYNIMVVTVESIPQQ